MPQPDLPLQPALPPWDLTGKNELMTFLPGLGLRACKGLVFIRYEVYYLFCQLFVFCFFGFLFSSQYQKD